MSAHFRSLMKTGPVKIKPPKKIIFIEPEKFGSEEERVAVLSQRALEAVRKLSEGTHRESHRQS